MKPLKEPKEMSVDCFDVIRAARTFVRNSRVKSITPQIILYIMLDNAYGKSLANDALTAMVENAGQLRFDLMQGVGDQRFGESANAELIPYSDETTRAFQEAEEERRLLGHEGEVDSEHLLLGIIRHRECEAAKILARYGVNLDNAREQVLLAIEKAGLVGVN